jgi:glycosyltransferase involved in cell wall biosynthesis
MLTMNLERINLKNPELSIIIPTINEENYLPYLLESIKIQTYKDFEIIVVDGNSKDNTVKIAKKFNCKVFKEPKNQRTHPSKARNIGSKFSKGNLILYLDADVILPYKNSLDKMINEFKNKNLSIATCYLKPKKENFFSNLSHTVFNYYLKIFEKKISKIS